MAQDEKNYYIATSIFLIIGAVMMIVAFLGCCGAFKESQCMLVSFFCLLLIVIVSEVAAGSWAYYNNAKLYDVARAHVKTTVKDEYSVVKSRTAVFDAVQKHLHCCGADGPSDWAGSQYNLKLAQSDKIDTIGTVLASVTGIGKYTLPESCCKTRATREECNSSRVVILTSAFNTHINTEGCVDKVINYFKEHMPTLLIIVICVLAVQIVGLILALFLCCAIQRNDHYKA